MRDIDKPSIVNLAVDLCHMGFLLVATTGTAQSLEKAGLKVEKIKKVLEGRPHVVDNMISGQIDLVINTTEGAQAIKDSFSLRRAAITHNIPYYTTIEGAQAAVKGIEALKGLYL